jgi:hypothetical protein
MPRGISFKPSEEQLQVTLECPHQHGRLYIVGSEMNWICRASRRPAHSLAGFFGELGELENERVKELMKRWGMYYRPLPLAEKAPGRRIKSTPGRPTGI